MIIGLSAFGVCHQHILAGMLDRVTSHQLGDSEPGSHSPLPEHSPPWEPVI